MKAPGWGGAPWLTAAESLRPQLRRRAHSLPRGDGRGTGTRAAGQALVGRLELRLSLGSQAPLRPQLPPVLPSGAARAAGRQHTREQEDFILNLRNL